jgi:hypothetical protein
MARNSNPICNKIATVVPHMARYNVIIKCIILKTCFFFLSGTGRQAYQLRAELFYANFTKTNLVAGVISYDCNITITDVVQRFLKMTPSLHETTICSSPYCPSKTQTRDIPLVTIDSTILQDQGISHLEQAVINGMAGDVVYCARIVHDDLVPEEYTVFDLNLSKTHRLCSGHRTRHTTTGCGLFIEVSYFDTYTE